MGKRAAVLGGGVAGLASAIALAREGWSVTVVERDAGPDPGSDGDGAFQTWTRPGVPQFRQAHGFSARARNLLLARIPDAVDAMRADGVEELNIFRLLAPPELWREEDDEFTGLLTRRPGFELPLRRIAEAEPGVDLRSPAAAAGLTYGEPIDGVPRVTGLRLESGETVEADVVLDCGGRRSPALRWLAADTGVAIAEDVEDCDTMYLTRYYRLKPGAPLAMAMVFGLRGELEGVAFGGFPGDHDTFALTVFVMPDDTDVRVLREPWAFDALVASIPLTAPWGDPANTEPLGDPQVMAGHHNARRRPIVDGRPAVAGVLLVGDSLCTTNPQYGWGASMALTYAFAAVDAIVAHADDPMAVAAAYDAAVGGEADAVYEESAATDRARRYRWRGLEVPEWDRASVERQNLIGEGLARGATRDPVLGRAFLRRTNLLDPPSAAFEDPEVEANARATQAYHASRPPRRVGPDRRELLEILAARVPGSA
jgi:2-polyprenyl-6-methoxyphenol hydroxylase-like FAD-dependent oxidoreductase